MNSLLLDAAVLAAKSPEPPNAGSELWALEAEEEEAHASSADSAEDGGRVWGKRFFSE